MIEPVIRQGETIELDINSNQEKINLGIEKASGTSDYNKLTGKPKINGVIVENEKLGEDYKLQDKMHTLDPWEIEKILYLD